MKDRVVITITVDVFTITGDVERVARRRKEELEGWFKRHKDDIQNVCSNFDEIDIECELTQKPEPH